ncbi:hypothetical protein ASD52_33965 [Ensifer sp. Root142]|uniref:polysaccharide pyruvyl transferase family protein n=1 Tax=Ensifer sp. Root142 TaxID=1736461 RepID=UPI00070FA07E|nr:polysaccharide pyruvyl transferase family protein [Ensifer sp. Root142]KQY68039.1 hypothetical protein ASD52_33965 [Ensifer sp. Root142]
MARILVMIPAGEVYAHDSVRWYQHQDIQFHINHYHNMGDAFVFDSSLKLLRFEELGVLEISEFRPRDIARLREEYDYVFLRGSNYIHDAMNWEAAATVLKALGLPVIGFGIGAQAPVDGKIRLSDDTRAVLRLMSESTTSVGVRGAYSAEVLWDLGIRNVRIIGCPTAFRLNDPELRITLPPLEQVRKVGVTVRREVSDAYAKDIERYLGFHRELVKTMAGRFETVLLTQGEVEEKKLVLGDEAQREEALAALKADHWTSSWYLDEAMLGLYEQRLFYSDVVADYERLIRAQDLVLGYRLHGNLMALANGVPSIYCTYDSRTAEFCDTFKIPSFDIFGQQAFCLEDYWDQALFDRYNRAWFHTYGEMYRFLTENGVEHKMHDILKSTPAKISRVA